MTKSYTLRQTTPDQITTHWDTCYTLHSACMERKVETMTAELARLIAERDHWRKLASAVAGDGREGESE